MFEEYVFLDEQGRNISGIAAPFDIGNRIINENGEWVIEGLVSNVETTITYPTFLESILGKKREVQKIYKRTYILKRAKNGKEQKQTKKYSK